MNALAALILGMALGATLIWGRIGFAGAFRAWQTDNRADGLAPLFVFLGAGIVLHAIAFGAFGASGGFVAPAGVTVAFGAFVFGIGMQLANACGSGTLAALGSGSTRMLAVLPFFVAGAVLGTLNADFWDALPAPPALSLGEALGWPIATLAQLVLLAVLWIAVAHRARPERRACIAALALAAFAVLAYCWGLTARLFSSKPRPARRGFVFQKPPWSRLLSFAARIAVTASALDIPNVVRRWGSSGRGAERKFRHSQSAAWSMRSSCSWSIVSGRAIMRPSLGWAGGRDRQAIRPMH